MERDGKVEQGQQMEYIDVRPAEGTEGSQTTCFGVFLGFLLPQCGNAYELSAMKLTLHVVR